MRPAEHTALAWVEVARRRAGFARLLLWIAITALAASWAWTVFGMLLMGGVPDLGAGWPDWWDPILMLINGGFLLCHLLTAIAVIASQRAFTRCLGWFGVREPRPSVAWGSWGWFVPIANWFVPWQAFRQLTDVVPEAAAATLRRSIGRWWACWLLGAASTNIAARITQWTETQRAWLFASALDLVGSATLIAAGLVLIGILGRLSTEYLRLAIDREQQLSAAAERRLAAASEPAVEPVVQLDMPFQPQVS